MDEAVLIFMGLMIPTVGILVMIVYLRKFINVERMAMIEKGVDPQLFSVSRPRYTAGALRASLLMIGGGVGLLMGILLDKPGTWKKQVISRCSLSAEELASGQRTL